MVKFGLKECRLTLMIFLAVFTVFSQGLSTPRDLAQEVAQADEMFGNGRFDEAFQLYAQAAEKDPSQYGAVIGLARIHLLRNSLNEAEEALKKAIALKPQEQEPQALMGEVLYRRDRYAQAAPFFDAAGRKARAEKMKAFEGKTPFQIESGPKVAILPFLQTDPLPIVRVTVNGQEGKFLIDTGGWELHVLPDFAEKCGLKPLGEKQTGTYAGGLQASVSNAVADRVNLGEFALRNVPVVLPERRPSPFEIDGIIGTVVLYHFIFTLDYPGGRLILRRNTPEMSRAVAAESASAGAARIPFWLAGDHFAYAWGTANGAGPYLFFVDTGLAGGGFTCFDYVVKEAKIELPKEGIQGMGGGGPITVYPFKVDLTLGQVRRDDIQGMNGALPPGSESRNGFRTGGIISHEFFRPFAVTFDFQAMALYLKAIRISGFPPEEFQRPG